MKSELPLPAKVAAGMQIILAISMTVEFLKLAIRLCQLRGVELGGGGWGSHLQYPVGLLVFLLGVLFSPPLGLSWLSAYRMWRGKKSGWIFGIASCFACAVAFLVLAKLLIVIPVLGLILLLVPAVREFYIDDGWAPHP
jgi:hypothetical protein